MLNIIPLYVGFHHAFLADLLGLSQDHPWHPPLSRMDGVRVTAATYHGGGVRAITSAQRAPESLCGYCTFLLLSDRISCGFRALMP